MKFIPQTPKRTLNKSFLKQRPRPGKGSWRDVAGKRAVCDATGDAMKGYTITIFTCY